MMPISLELLAPARDAAIARDAILHGADAVYIGGPSHGARASAANSIQDISALTAFAHTFGVKVYVTLNTIIYDSELAEVERNIRALYDAGVDALIVQDMALLRMDIPPIDIHASTQCDIRTPQKALFLAQCGFSQLVLPREFSLEQIRQVRKAVGADIKLEAFVHGALCVSYSGDCQASCVAMGRSANRGECAQMCRLPYTLTDARGNVLMRDRHLLSLRDLNRLPHLQDLAEAGISSFKIEGRLKDATYVRTTVAAYRQAIDRLIDKYPDRYCRASYGRSSYAFVPDVDKAFNRGFTSYFLHGKPMEPVSMANIDSPKWVGQPVGRVVRTAGKAVVARLSASLNNGDGLGYFDSSRRFCGFRLNRIDGDKLYPASPVNIPLGTELYRNSDIKYNQLVSADTTQRLLGISMKLTASMHADDVSLCLTLNCENGSTVSESMTLPYQSARTPQHQARQKALSKVGGTVFRIDEYADSVDSDCFVPLSSLSSLRQQAIAKLQEQIIADYRPQHRRAECPDAALPDTNLTYHHNVANRLAERFYRDHGATSIERAIETLSGPHTGACVMTTRYCLRRELGACLLTPDGKKFPEPLYITNDSARYRLSFDCKNCQMHLFEGR